MKIHEFENGVKVYDRQLLSVQKLRYQKRNVHEEDEEDIFLNAIKDLPCGAYYVNIGSAIGYYPLLAKKVRPDIKVFCFEPLPLHSSFFADNIILNGFRKEDFVVYNFAVSSTSTVVALKDHSYGSYVMTGPVDETSIPVDAILLSEIFGLIGTRVIDFVQMDIQGHEESVLKAYFSRNITVPGLIQSFLIGTHGHSIHKNCRDLLIDNNYTVKLDEPNTINQPDGIIFCCMNKDLMKEQDPLQRPASPGLV